MKTVKARPLTVRYMLTIALCAAVGARLTAQEEVPVAELLEEAAPAAAAAEAPAADPAPAAEAPAAEPVVAEAAVPEVEAVPAPEPEPVAEVAAPAPAAVEAPAPVVEAAPAGNGDGKAIVTVDDKNELMDSSSYDSGKITVALDGIPLADVVQLFTRLSGANIICNATNLQGTVTANLDNVDWEPAFRAILERQGLLLTEDPMNKGIFSIDPKSPDAPEPWVTETFKLSYLKSGDAAEMLSSMLGLADETAAKPAARKKAEDDDEVDVVVRKEGRVVSYPAGNMVVVSTTAARMEEIRKVLDEVDVPRQQVYIEAKIVEVRGGDSKKIGIDWSMLDGYKVGLGNLGMNYKKTRQRERGGANFSAAEAAAVYDDRGRRQSTASAVGDQGMAAALNPVAIANSTIAPGYAAVESATPGLSTYAGQNNVNARFTSITDVRTAIFGADAMTWMISALQKSEDALVVSNPKVIVANEEEALIDMARKEPYVTVERKTDGTGANTTYTFTTKMEVIPGELKENKLLPYIEQAFFTYGIKLEVTPRINNASNITVVVRPTLSEKINEYMPAGEGSTRYPIIQSKHVRTVFSLGDGQTAVIGGLTQSRDTDVVKKVPLLGDIPLLGKYFFTHTEKAKEQFETIIFVTVGIVDSEQPEMALAVPEATKLVQKHVNPDGKLIDKNAALVPEVVE